MSERASQPAEGRGSRTGLLSRSVCIQPRGQWGQHSLTVNWRTSPLSTSSRSFSGVMAWATF